MTTFGPSFEELLNQALEAGATDTEFEPDEADYIVMVSGTSTEVTDKDKQLARVRLKVLEGKDADHTFSLALFFTTPFATEKSVRILASFGVDFAGVKDLDGLERAMRAIRGAQAQVRVSYEGGYLRVVVLALKLPERPASTSTAPVDESGDLFDEPPF